MKKKVLLAIGNEKFNLLLRRPLSEHFMVLNDEVYSRKYLEEFIDDQSPDIIIIHDYYLTSEKMDQFEKEVELLQIIERIRRIYDDEKRIVFMCERNQGDPFLSELVNRNVLDIFHSRSLDLKQIIEQLTDQPRYSRVAYLKVEGSSKHYKSIGNALFVEELPDEEPKAIEKSPEPEEEEKKVSKFTLPKIPKPNFSFPKKEKAPKPEKEVKQEVKQEVQPEKKILPLKQEVIEDEHENYEEEPAEKETGKRRKPRFNLFGGGSNKEEYNLGTFRPRLIAVGSLHPGAGSSFFLYNFTRYLSDMGVPSSILEALNDIDALFALVGSESPPKFEWESVHNLLMEENTKYLYSIPKWSVERTIYIPTLNVTKDQFQSHHAKELLYFARQSPLVFVDISHDWEDPISKEVLSMCDELWCVTEPNPMYLEVQRKHHQIIYQVSNRCGDDNVIVLGNKWGNGVDSTRFPELYAKIPYIPENVKAMSNNVPVYRLKSKGLADFDKLYERLNASIM